MAKFSATYKLTKKEQQELFINFAKALASIKNPIEAANFIKDLLSEGEVLMLARRLQIADLLMENLTYKQIEKLIKVSNTTIARVHNWLNLYGEGYRLINKRTKSFKKLEHIENDTFSSLKRKYPMYYWPELVLKEIVKNSNLKQRRKLISVLEKMKEKTQLNKQLTKLLQLDKHYHTQ